VSPFPACSVERRRTFLPSYHPHARCWWHLPDLADGSVSSWIDRVNTVEFAQAVAANQPTKSGTGFAGAYPAISSDGNDMLVATGVGPLFSGTTKMTFVSVMEDSTGAVALPFEYTDNFNNAGRTGPLCFVNDPSAGKLGCATKSAAGFTSGSISETLATRAVVSIGVDLALNGTNQVKFIRINKVAQSISFSLGGALATTFPDYPFYLFARVGISLPWAGKYGDVILLGDATEDSWLESCEDFAAGEAGVW